jgi:hypothetical protein
MSSDPSAFDPRPVYVPPEDIRKTADRTADIPTCRNIIERFLRGEPLPGESIRGAIELLLSDHEKLQQKCSE